MSGLGEDTNGAQKSNLPIPNGEIDTRGTKGNPHGVNETSSNRRKVSSLFGADSDLVANQERLARMF